MTLRRSPMPPRTKPMARSTKPMRAVSPKKRSWKREAKALQLAFMESHLRCAVCGISVFARPSRPLQLHHLMSKGSQRHECVENYAALCDRDHAHFHGGGEFGDDGQRLPKLTGGHLLWAKAQADGLDAKLLASLRGWVNLPDAWEPTPLPSAFILERERNGL